MSISVQKLEKNFGSFKALDTVDLEIRTGELVALLGPSGSGKTTLLRILAGLDVPTSGRIDIHGEDATKTHVRKRGVGFVFQHYALFRHMTIADNIGYGLSVKKRSERPKKEEISARINELLSLIQLDSIGHRYPHELSGGQRQRVALARALAVEPRFLLLDEPFGALDAKVREELRRWLRRLHDKLGLTSVFVTHDQEEALELADRVVILNKGRIEQAGTPEEVVTKPASEFVFGFLGNATRFDGIIDKGEFRLPEGTRWSLAGFEPEEGAPVHAYVRPWDFIIDRDRSPSSIRAHILHRYIAGQSYRIELESPEGPDHIKVEVSPERFKALDLGVGETVYLEPRSLRLFRQNGTPARSIGAELNYTI